MGRDARILVGYKCSRDEPYGLQTGVKLCVVSNCLEHQISSDKSLHHLDIKFDLCDDSRENVGMLKLNLRPF